MGGLKPASEPRGAFIPRLGRRLVAAVLLVPLIYVGYSYLGQQATQIGFSAKERVGVTYVIPAENLVAQVAAGRTLATAAAAGNATAASQLAAQAAWTAATNGSVNLITQVGNMSTLILDPDLDSFYVMDALIVKSPALIASSSLAADRELLMTGAAGRSLNARIQWAVDKGVISNLTSGLSSDLTTAFASTHDSGLAAAVRPRLAPVTTAHAGIARGVGRLARDGHDHL